MNEFALFAIEWDELLDGLAEHFTVHAPEHPGSVIMGCGSGTRDHGRHVGAVDHARRGHHPS
jgi:hypothetical protein